MASTTDFDADALREKYLLERDKRLRDDGNEQYLEMAGRFADYLADPYVDRIDRPALTDDVTVAIIGGGFAGLVTGARLRQGGIDDIRIIEKGGDFGGTWYWNRYPGAQCDVESYVYLPLLEETSYVPSEKYAHAPEILEHCHRIATHFDLYSRGLPLHRGHRDRVGRRPAPVDDPHRSRRRDVGAIPRHGERAPAPPQTAGRPRHRELRWPHIPYQPLGLLLHGRRLERRPHRPARQACRDHRDGRDGRAGRPPRRRGRG